LAANRRELYLPGSSGSNDFVSRSFSLMVAMRTTLTILMIAGASLIALGTPAEAAPCWGDLNPTDDSGVSVSCNVPTSDTVCTASVQGNRLGDAADVGCVY
jgi:hypothetical protein